METSTSVDALSSNFFCHFLILLYSCVCMSMLACARVQTLWFGPYSSNVKSIYTERQNCEMVKSNCLSTKSCPLSLTSRLLLGHLPEPLFSRGLFWGLIRMIHGKLLNTIWGSHSLVRAQDWLSWMTCAAQEMNPTYGHGEDTGVICSSGVGVGAPGDNVYYMVQGRVVIAVTPVLQTDFSI